MNMDTILLDTASSCKSVATIATYALFVTGDVDKAVAFLDDLAASVPPAPLNGPAIAAQAIREAVGIVMEQAG